MVMKSHLIYYVYRRERHAKTLEIAQEEVLTCLGLFLFERLQRIHTRMREEEQTWDILFHVAVDTLKKNFEVNQSLCEFRTGKMLKLCVNHWLSHSASASQIQSERVNVSE